MQRAGAAPRARRYGAIAPRGQELNPASPPPIRHLDPRQPKPPLVEEHAPLARLEVDLQRPRADIFARSGRTPRRDRPRPRCRSTRTGRTPAAPPRSRSISYGISPNQTMSGRTWPAIVARRAARDTVVHRPVPREPLVARQAPPAASTRHACGSAASPPPARADRRHSASRSATRPATRHPAAPARHAPHWARPRPAAPAARRRIAAPAPDRARTPRASRHPRPDAPPTGRPPRGTSPARSPR